MSGFKEKSFSDRLKAAEEAKKKALAKFKAKPGPDDPEFIARQAKRAEIEAAREVRNAEREVARQAELARQAI